LDLALAVSNEAHLPDSIERFNHQLFDLLVGNFGDFARGFVPETAIDDRLCVGIVFSMTGR
jgi:hypothetical protein